MTLQLSITYFFPDHKIGAFYSNTFKEAEYGEEGMCGEGDTASSGVRAVNFA